MGCVKQNCLYIFPIPEFIIKHNDGTETVINEHFDEQYILQAVKNGNFETFEYLWKHVIRDKVNWTRYKCYMDENFEDSWYWCRWPDHGTIDYLDMHSRFQTYKLIAKENQNYEFVKGLEYIYTQYWNKNHYNCPSLPKNI